MSDIYSDDFEFEKSDDDQPAPGPAAASTPKTTSDPKKDDLTASNDRSRAATDVDQLRGANDALRAQLRDFSRDLDSHVGASGATSPALADKPGRSNEAWEHEDTIDRHHLSPREPADKRNNNGGNGRRGRPPRYGAARQLHSSASARSNVSRTRNKDVNMSAIRLMEAHGERVSELENMLGAREREIAKLRDENRGLKETERRQGRGIEELERQAGNLPEILKHYNEEVRVMKEKCKQYAERTLAVERQLRVKDERLNKYKDRCEKLMQILQDKELDVKKNLAEELDKVTKENAVKDEKLAEYERNIEILKKSTEGVERKYRQKLKIALTELQRAKERIDVLMFEQRKANKDALVQAGKQNNISHIAHGADDEDASLDASDVNNGSRTARDANPVSALSPPAPRHTRTSDTTASSSTAAAPATSATSASANVRITTRDGAVATESPRGDRKQSSDPGSAKPQAAGGAKPSPLRSPQSSTDQMSKKEPKAVSPAAPEPKPEPKQPEPPKQADVFAPFSFKPSTAYAGLQASVGSGSAAAAPAADNKGTGSPRARPSAASIPSSRRDDLDEPAPQASSSKISFRNEIPENIPGGDSSGGRPQDEFKVNFAVHTPYNAPPTSSGGTVTGGAAGGGYGAFGGGNTPRDRRVDDPLPWEKPTQQEEPPRTGGNGRSRDGVSPGERAGIDYLSGDSSSYGSGYPSNGNGANSGGAGGNLGVTAGYGGKPPLSGGGRSGSYGVGGLAGAGGNNIGAPSNNAGGMSFIGFPSSTAGSAGLGGVNNGGASTNLSGAPTGSQPNSNAPLGSATRGVSALPDWLGGGSAKQDGPLGAPTTTTSTASSGGSGGKQVPDWLAALDQPTRGEPPLNAVPPLRNNVPTGGDPFGPSNGSGGGLGFKQPKGFGGASSGGGGGGLFGNNTGAGGLATATSGGYSGGSTTTNKNNFDGYGGGGGGAGTTPRSYESETTTALGSGAPRPASPFGRRSNTRSTMPSLDGDTGLGNGAPRQRNEYGGLFGSADPPPNRNTNIIW